MKEQVKTQKETKTETTETAKTPVTVEISKSQSNDLVKKKRQELNRNFKNLSQIWNYLKRNSGTDSLKDYADAKKVNENVSEIATLILQADLFGTFRRYHNEIKGYKNEPTTPSQCFDRLIVMSKDVRKNAKHGEQITDKDIELYMVPQKK